MRDVQKVCVSLCCYFSNSSHTADALNFRFSVLGTPKRNKSPFFLMQGRTYRIVLRIDDDYKVIDDSCLLSYTGSKGSLVKEALICQLSAKGYTTDWVCSANPCKDGERNTMELMLPVDDYGSCKCRSPRALRVVCCLLSRPACLAPRNHGTLHLIQNCIAHLMRTSVSHGS
jgi:hypothetical protein